MSAHGRVGARAFPFFLFKKSAARPRSGQCGRAKRKGGLGGEMNFYPPAAISGEVPAAPQARQSVNFVQNRFGFGSINALANLGG